MLRILLWLLVGGSVVWLIRNPIYIDIDVQRMTSWRNGQIIPRETPVATSSVPSTTIAVEQVEFAPGATSTTINNELPERTIQVYRLNCQAGQTLTLKVEQGNVQANIIAPSGHPIGSTTETVTVQLTQSGDHQVRIRSLERTSYQITIEVL